MDVRVSGPPGEGYRPEPGVLEECAKLAQVPGAGRARVMPTAEAAVEGADFVYADSWLSYGIAGEERASRLAALMPWQVIFKSYSRRRVKWEQK